MTKTAEWKIERKPNIREGRHDVWWVTCPNDPELTWDNDFGRGMRCGCRRFPSQGKATRYVERMKSQVESVNADAISIPS